MKMKDVFKKMDKTLFFLMLLYTILGLVMIFSASSITAVLYNRVEESYFFKKQLVFVIASWVMGIGFVMKFPTSKYKGIAPLAMVGIIAAIMISTLKPQEFRQRGLKVAAKKVLGDIDLATSEILLNKFHL